MQTASSTIELESPSTFLSTSTVTPRCCSRVGTSESFWVTYSNVRSVKQLQANLLAIRQSVLRSSSILFTNPSGRAGYDSRSIFKRSLTGLNLEFSFSQTSCLTKAEETSLSYYLTIAGGRIIGFIPFPRLLVPCEMQSVSLNSSRRVHFLRR